MPAKTLAIDPDTAPPMCPPLGLGVATDSVMVDGWAVQTMVRAAPAHEEDSGWSFTSGLETPEELADPDRSGAYDLDLVANVDPDVLPYLTWPVGTVVERATPSSPLVVVEGPEEPPTVRLLPPVDAGLVRVADAWQLVAPTRLLRWVDGSDLVFWRPGLTARLAVYQGPADPAARILELRAGISAEATHIEQDPHGAVARLTYRLAEEGAAGLYGFLRTPDEELHLVLHFEDEAGEVQARAMLATVGPARG